ncbi:hypothetical protein KL925_004942 [Ogataea polymorpha]|nr:hypothetical protein KL925_004942 [Ogataea polymorpha]
MACSHTVDVRALARGVGLKHLLDAAEQTYAKLQSLELQESKIDNNLHRANLYEESLVASANVAEVQRSVDGQASKALLAWSVTTLA